MPHSPGLAVQPAPMNRDAGIEFVRRNYADALEKFGIDGEQARAWLELQIKEIRSLIEASGGTGGRA